MKLFAFAAVLVCFAGLTASSGADDSWRPWRSSLSGGGIFAISDTFFGESTASGYLVDYELSLPRRFGIFGNYRSMEFDASYLDYTRTTRWFTEGKVEGFSFGGRYYPHVGPWARVYIELGYGLWDVEEDNYRNGIFDGHETYDANAVLLGCGAKVPLFDSPVELTCSIGAGYLWWDMEHYSDDDFYLTFGIGLGVTL